MGVETQIGAKKRRGNVEWIVVHYTGVVASARSVRNSLVRSYPERKVSTHYIIDEKNEIEMLNPYFVANHIGGASKTKRLPVTNANSIGVDICPKKINWKTTNAGDTDWYIPVIVEVRACDFVARLALQYGVPLDHIVRHYDVTGKLCPRPWCGEDENEYYNESGDSKWEFFKNHVKDVIKDLTDQVDARY